MVLEVFRSVGSIPVALWLVLFSSSASHVEGSTSGGGGGGRSARTGGFIGGGGFGFWPSYSPSYVGIAVAVTAMAGIALVATLAYSNR